MSTDESGSVPHIWAPDSETWRTWLHANHKTASAAWLCYFKKNAGEPSIDWSSAVDEALCFGWIDSVIQPLDDRSYKQYFTPRKPKSNWALINKAKVERLIEEDRMTAAGMAAIERAKTNGSWHLTDERAALAMPEDLAVQLAANPVLRVTFDALSPIRQWELLHWINGARSPQTRADRVRRVLEALADNRRPDGYRL